jgi:hypothetical protein
VKPLLDTDFGRCYARELETERHGSVTIVEKIMMITFQHVQLATNFFIKSSTFHLSRYVQHERGWPPESDVRTDRDPWYGPTNLQHRALQQTDIMVLLRLI